VDKDNTVIGFIGTGVMGRSMAGHLIKNGYRLHVYNRTKAKAETLIGDGATWENSTALLAACCDVIVTIVGFPKDVEQVYFGSDGLIENARPDTCLIDMTTSEPELAARIDEECRKLGLHALDAPVSGGDTGARQARLSVMVGGEEDVFNAVLPLFETMGRNIVLQGKAGSGQHTKMANQIAIASNMMGVCEALAYATKSGLDPSRVLESIESGAAGSWSLSNLGPRMIAGNFEPGFFVKHFLKDMKIGLKSARAMGLPTPGLELARSLYGELAEKGHENDGTHGLYRLFSGGRGL